jgi:hypothetical protein
LSRTANQRCPRSSHGSVSCRSRQSRASRTRIPLCCLTSGDEPQLKV